LKVLSLVGLAISSCDFFPSPCRCLWVSVLSASHCFFVFFRLFWIYVISSVVCS
jgi:hypothetical protein